MNEHGRPVAEMSTLLLVTTAERMCGMVERWAEMTPETRSAQKSPGLASPNTFLSALTLPLLYSFLTEIHRRGIETGWEWFTEIYKEEVM